MKSLSHFGFASATALCVIASMAFSAAYADETASPIYGVTIPVGYRQWELIAPSHEALLDELRGILGNPVAMKAYRKGTLPFPDGTILAKVAWKHVPSAEDNGALGQFQAFVPSSSITRFFTKRRRLEALNCYLGECRLPRHSQKSAASPWS